MENLKNNQSETGSQKETTSSHEEQIVFGQTKKVEYVSFSHNSKVQLRQQTFNRSWNRK